MLYIRLAFSEGIAEVCDAESCVIEADELVLRAPDGHVVARFPRLDVLAFSSRRERLVHEEDAEEASSP